MNFFVRRIEKYLGKNMSTQELKEQVRRLVGLAKIQQAIDVLYQFLNNTGHDQRDLVLQLKAQWAQKEREKMLGIADSTHDRQESARIAQALLQVLDLLEDETVKTILFIAANPESTTRLRVDKEMRLVQDELTRANYRSKFKLELLPAATKDTLQQGMLDKRPAIVHFSGHGAADAQAFANHSGPERGLMHKADYEAGREAAQPETGGILLEAPGGDAHLVTSKALAGLFMLCADHVECVVLNSCYSEKQAQLIAQNIPYVVGMSRSLPDDTAIAFAKGFYMALGAGQDYESAFAHGKAAVNLANISGSNIAVIYKDGSIID